MRRPRGSFTPRRPRRAAAASHCDLPTAASSSLLQHGPRRLLHLHQLVQHGCRLARSTAQHAIWHAHGKNSSCRRLWQSSCVFALSFCIASVSYRTLASKNPRARDALPTGPGYRRLRRFNKNSADSQSALKIDVHSRQLPRTRGRPGRRRQRAHRTMRSSIAVALALAAGAHGVAVESESKSKSHVFGRDGRPGPAVGHGRPPPPRLGKDDRASQRRARKDAASTKEPSSTPRPHRGEVRLVCRTIRRRPMRSRSTPTV